MNLKKQSKSLKWRLEPVEEEVDAMDLDGEEDESVDAIDLDDSKSTYRPKK